MKDTTKYVGLDVSKEKIDVAIADAGREAPRYWGTIPHKPEAIRKLIKQLGDPKTLEFCYEAGPTSFDMQAAKRFFTKTLSSPHIQIPRVIT